MTHQPTRILFCFYECAAWVWHTLTTGGYQCAKCDGLVVYAISEGIEL